MITNEEHHSADQMADAACKVYNALLSACRILALYPAGHVLSVSAAEQLHAGIHAYLKSFGTLRFDIERDSILSAGIPLSKTPIEERNPVFSLFRDGIRWLEFAEGLSVEELAGILGIINRYSVLDAEPEGDIAVSFWEAQFPHLRYDVTDFAFTLPEIAPGSGVHDSERRLGSNRTVFTSKQLVRMDLFQTPGQKARHEQPLPTNPMPDMPPPLSADASYLSPEEMRALRERVAIEEQADPTAYIDALLDSLLQHEEKESAEWILAALAEEFTISMRRRDFDASLKILTGIEQIGEYTAGRIPWTGTVLQGFFRKISSAESLVILKEIWCGIDPKQLDTFGQILKRLHPAASVSIAPLLLFAYAPELQQLLEDVLIYLINRDVQPLRTLLAHPDNRLLERLVALISRLDNNRAFPLLLQLAQHQNVKLRRLAVSTIVASEPGRLKDLFGLFVRDEEASIRHLILEHLGHSRNEVAERLLLSYLQYGPLKKAPEALVMACYVALGRCGSARAIPFLRKTLLTWGWVPGYRRLLHRAAASIALCNLDLPEAKTVLMEAARSWYPGIRRLACKAWGVSAYEERGH